MSAPDALPAAAILGELDKVLARDMELEDVWGAARVGAQSEHRKLSEQIDAHEVTLSHSGPLTAIEAVEQLRLASAVIGRALKMTDEDYRQVSLALARRLVDQARRFLATTTNDPLPWPRLAEHYGE